MTLINFIRLQKVKDKARLTLIFVTSNLFTKSSDILYKFPRKSCCAN